MRLLLLIILLLFPLTLHAEEPTWLDQLTDTVFAPQKRHNDAVLAEQKKQLDVIQEEFNQNIAKIQQDQKDGHITHEEAHQLMLKEYEKSNDKNLEILQDTMDNLVPR